MIVLELRHALCCSRKAETTRKMRRLYTEDTLCSFLVSSFNIEYVYLMLQGLTKVLKDRETRGKKSLYSRN